MRFLGAAVSVVLVIASMPAASKEVKFCSEWKGFNKNYKAEFIVIQSQAFMTQWKPKHWIQVSPCFRREAPKWVYRIDDACSANVPANVDIGMTMGALAGTMFVQCSVELSRDGAASAAKSAPDYTEYRSTSGHYRVRYGATWSVKTTVEEPGVDMMLMCAAEECGFGSLITFGILYDPQDASASTEKMVSLMNSELMTARVRDSPLVSSIEVHEEGRTTMGTLPAYQVRMTVRFTNGSVRIRHSFFTFSRGYYYNVSLHADLEKYQSARRSAQQILSTFSPL